LRGLYIPKNTGKSAESHIYSRMEARELRIGNYYQNKSNDLELKYKEIQYVEDILYVSVYCDAIPLTEEWLIKFGFEKVIYDSDETGYGTDYELDIKGVGCISYSDDFSCALFGSKESSKHELGFLPNWDNCKHVHSLQNLYFALTGEELKIKE
jgi:hypothetical protein